MLWHVSDDDGKKTCCFYRLLSLANTILTEQHFFINHKGPDGFCFESQYHKGCHDTPIIDHPRQGKVNVDEKLKEFMNYIHKRVILLTVFMKLKKFRYQHNNINIYWY